MFKKIMDTLSSTSTKVISGTKLLVAVFVMFGAGAIALASVPVNQNSWGCYLSVNGTKIKIANTFNECHDYYLAREYAGRRDFYKLLKNDGRVISEDKITNADNVVDVFYKNEDDNKIVTGIKLGNNNIISSNKCQKNTFFGIELYCFNELAASAAEHTSGNFIKPDNYAAVIKYLTFMKYTSRPLKNYLTNQTIAPFTELVNYKTKIADASKISYLEGIYNGFGDHCSDGKAGAYTGRKTLDDPMVNKVFFICPKNLNIEQVSTDEKLKLQIHMAGVMYHEALHFSATGQGHKYIMENDKCVVDPTNQGNADLDANRVYGGQIRYLLDISKNDLVDCSSVRKYAYEKAELEIAKSICSPLKKLLLDTTKAPVCN
ncbi:MAG: hypothetical protein US42_C0003G0021 [Candidatus Magasanikbacteria bacterium GW2011_GWC2_37_14]|uniref:Uncharacterized protein n=1 Tax=Candidatus Magasanikbacteria bacterium GW2011_GWC2_37_14 TaxID=1619046 RepID=A0A0G0IUX0_9BACT|nr:MAG: hypothetical protein US42_C0003G0021 [Candidatus Magasanikbacteria bacterium GW2011_GWC2_37_14]